MKISGLLTAQAALYDGKKWTSIHGGTQRALLRRGLVTEKGELKRRPSFSIFMARRWAEVLAVERVLAAQECLLGYAGLSPGASPDRNANQSQEVGKRDIRA